MAYAYVQSTTGSSSLTISSTVAGNLLVCMFAWSDSGDTNPTLTGFTAAGSGKITDSSNYSTRCFYRANVSAGITSISVASWDNGTPSELGCAGGEWSGIATSSSLIVAAGQVQASPGTGANGATSGNGNVTSQPAMVLGLSGTIGSSTTYTAGTGYTSRTASSGWGIEDKRVTATGNQAATFTLGANNEVQTWVLAFAEAGGGGTTVGGQVLGGRLIRPSLIGA